MYIFTNPHPQGKRVNDCVKRACCLGSGINYHDIAIMLNRWKKETGCSKFNSNDNYKSFIKDILMGWKITKDMRYIDNGHRYTVEDFASDHYDTTHILRCAGHLVTSKNGDYLDTWDSGYKSVYIAYLMPRYEIIVNHIKNNYPKLCKGLTLERIKL